MSVDMYVSASKNQAKSVSGMTKQQTAGYEELQKAIADFTLNSPFLTGKAYDTSKAFFSTVLYPLAQGGILLSEAVDKAVTKFPQDYQSQVDSGNLKQSDLEEKIRQVERLIGQAEGIRTMLESSLTPDIIKSSQLAANLRLLESYSGVKRILEEKLDKLMTFNHNSPRIFEEIQALEDAIDQGLAQTTTAFNPATGTFTIPNKGALSWSKTITDKWADYEARNTPKTDIRAQKINGGPEGEITIYEVYVDGVYDEEKTAELAWILAKQQLADSVHFVGEFVLVNDIYRLITGKDWLSGDEDSRLKAAGWLALTALPVGKLTQIVKELKVGNKALKGMALTEKELQILSKSGYFDGAGKVINTGKNTSSGLSKLEKQLIKQLEESGIKVSKEDVLKIKKLSKEQKIVWLEKGTEKAGFEHILLEHGEQFTKQGISIAEIPDFLINALEKGEIVGYQGRGKGRPIYEFIYNGEKRRVAITVGNNGFIVGANPVSIK